MKRDIVILLVFLTGVFCAGVLAAKADERSVLINEIAWMGGVESSSNEWIELKNITEAEVDLSGWTLNSVDGQPEILLNGKIPANGYFLLERTDDDSAAGVEADQIYTGALGNAGENLELKNIEGGLIDGVNMSSGWLFGDNAGKKTMARDENFDWQTSLEQGGTPRKGNIVEVPEIILEHNDAIESSPNTDSQEKTPLQQNNSIGEENSEEYKKVKINEFVSDPADGDVEWVELYNLSESDIDVVDWWIEEGSGSKTILHGQIRAGSYYLVEKPKGNLNNSGDFVGLYSSRGELADQVIYGNWDREQNNAPAAKDPMSVGRKTDGADTGNDFNDFEIMAPSKMGTNRIGQTEPDSFQYDLSDLLVSELYPNPPGPDSEDEFVEIFNNGDKDIDLDGFYLTDESSKKFIFKDKIIKAKSYLAVKRDESKIAFNNTSDSAYLYSPDAQLVDKLEYEEAAEGESYCLEIETISGDRKFVWSESKTPGRKNKIPVINHQPQFEISFPEKLFAGVPVYFDTSDTIDVDGDSLKFKWDFGDGFTNILPSPEHTYFLEGKYLVKAEVSDGINEVEKEFELQINKKNRKTNVASSSAEKSEVIISEFIPNPEGDDEEGEYIEIKNAGKTAVNLLDWSLDDMAGGSRPYLINENVYLSPGDYYIVNRTDSKLVLNNNFDEVRLLDPEEKVVDEVKYSKSKEGEAYVMDNQSWSWSRELTPGKKNIVKVSSIGSNKISKSSKIKYYRNINLKEIKNYAKGSLVKVKGKVAVLPGVFGSQYFYIAGSPGIQVYNYKKDFPLLRLGDEIEVRGEVSEIYGEKRIKTKTVEDIIVLKSGEALEPAKISGDEIDKSNTGYLAEVKGEVIDKNGFYITIADSKVESKAYIKKGTGIKIADFHEGDKVVIDGILANTKTDTVIMPRSNDDIEFLNKEEEQEGIVLGEVSQDDEWSIPHRQSKARYWWYLLIIGSGFGVFLAIKYYRGLKSGT